LPINNTHQPTVLIAGGSGLIGRKLQHVFENNGFKVLILTRNPKNTQDVYWDPFLKKIDLERIKDVEILINLCGENIGSKRWTPARKKALIDSRVEPTLFLATLIDKMPLVNYYLGASGVNCYEAESGVVYSEKAPYGTDFLSSIVKAWESAHAHILTKRNGAVLRIAMVLASEGGALESIKMPIQLGFGSVIGTGKQYGPWIHIDDLCNLFVFSVQNQLDGFYNALAANSTNLELTKAIAKQLNKPLWAPRVPTFVLRLLLGERSFLVLTNLQASSQKIVDAGFEYKYPTLEQAVKAALK
jgi:uncharacterized protein (TIGR01777 family)